MNYQVIHDRIIVGAILRGKPDGYYEEHHIIPKSFYNGKYASFKKHPWNRVYLSAKEHFIIHKLLVKIYKNKDIEKHRKMSYAINMMSKPCAKFDNRIKLTSVNYEFIRKELSVVTMSEEQRKKISDSHKGKSLSPEHKLSVSLSLRGRVPWNKGKLMTESYKLKLKGRPSPTKGKPRSAEAIEKSRLGNIGKHFRPHDEDTKEKIRQGKLGEKNPNYGKPATNRGIPHSDSTKEKIRLKALARPSVSEEARENMRAAALRRKMKMVDIGS